MQRALLYGLVAAGVVPLCLAAYQISPSAFHIAIIDGEGAMNNIKGRVAQEPIVQVQDENHKGVRGAYVTFDGPKSGPGVTFANGSTQFTTTTDDLGRAVAQGLKPNSATGSFDIHVHVTYQGQPVGDTVIHQFNVTGKVADLSHNLETGGSNANEAVVGAAMGPGVLGIAMGPAFVLNGSTVPDNANLMAGARIVSLDKTVRIHLQGGCDYLLAPNSVARIENHQLILEKGQVRARRCGNCKVAAGFFLISGDPGTDGVIGYAGGNVEVASLSGTLQVAGSQGTLAGTVVPGAYSTFGAQAGASGAAAGASGATASTGAAGASAKTLALYSTALAGALAGLGLAVDAVLQPGSPTSP
jgi:hypothetical protein